MLPAPPPSCCLQRQLLGYRRSLSGYRKLLGADIEEPVTLAVRRLLDATFVPLPYALEAEHGAVHVSPAAAAACAPCCQAVLLLHLVLLPTRHACTATRLCSMTQLLHCPADTA